MIKKLDPPFVYEDTHRAYLNSLKPWVGKYWSRKNQNMTSIKTFIRDKLSDLQENECAYCGFELEVTSAPEIEHIAPKGENLYPQFTFTETNLVFSCSFCNGYMKKWTTDTITTLNSDYQLCEFSIVHPYFDDPTEHYDWVDNIKSILIQRKSQKGENSIKLFDLDSSRLSEYRARILYSTSLDNPDLPSELLEEILKYRKLNF